ncbi:MAG: tRNA (adenosine(37)-N6)-threonylcarbamoyltransferase complex dimerization subunit type 1 TsaB [Gemmatimonadaceae bacterium]
MKQSLTLALDASTYLGSVAVVSGDRVLAECEVAMRGEFNERLMPAVASTLASANASQRDVRCIACGAGPGSFTSLRIAGSIAKGLATGWGVSFVPVPSLLLMVAGSQWCATKGRYLAALDAMRGELFIEGYEVKDGGLITSFAPLAVAAKDSVAAIATRLDATLVSPDLHERTAISASPHARGLARLWAVGWPLEAVDMDSWEPVYGRQAEAQVRLVKREAGSGNRESGVGSRESGVGDPQG